PRAASARVMDRQLAATAPRARRRSLGRQIWRARWCYLLMLPGLVLIAMFSVYPIFASFLYSLYNWDGITGLQDFIGLQNYAQLFHDSYFWASLGRSAWFAGIATPVELAVSLLIAIVLNDRALRLAPIFRTLFFIPVVTTTAVISIVMTFVFAAYGGPINQVLLDLHLTHSAINFLGNPHSVVWTAIGIFVWKWMGQPMIYWLAGLQTVPTELYEAAKVDGAGWFKQILHVTAPLMAPFALIIGLIQLVGNLQVFAFIQALTGGGPFFASETIEVFIFRMAFGVESSGQSTGRPEFGYASAAGVLFGVLLMAAVAVQALALRRLRPSRMAAGART
ncbi:MAG: sugar ABC transporter permease, partial [Candidatus Dormiibacterota bacterium]